MLKKSLTPKHYLLSLALMVSLGLISTACSQVSSTSALPTATVSSATLPAQTSASATPSAPTPDSPTATVSSATLPAPTPASATPGAPTSGSPAPTDQLRLVLDPAQSEARYQAREQLANISFPTDAVGTTKAISGTIVIDESGTIVSQASKFVVDLTTLKSDKAQRDRFIQRNTLQTDTYPTAEFVPTQVVGLPSPLPTSGPVTFQLVGDLTVYGVTHPTTWDVTAQVAGQALTGSASTSVTFEDFNMTPPRVPVVLSVEDNITLIVDFNLVLDTSGTS
jgi:polyisoprenoid-binding protein YceI